MKWLNEASGVLANCEQLEPVIVNGQVTRGRTVAGEFVEDVRGIDILHRRITGQIEMADNDARLTTWISANR